MDYNDLNNGVDSTYWYFAGKNDMLNRLSNKYLQKRKNQKILNISCGTGDDIDTLSKFGTVFGTEYSSETIKYCISATGFKKITKTDAIALNFKKETFDCVVILDVLEHLKNDTKAIKEIHRVLKNNGIAIISVPAHQLLWSNHDKSLGHIRRYSKKGLIDLINSQKLKIEKLTFWNSLLFYPVAAIRIFHRLTKNATNKPDVSPLAKPINTLLTHTLQIENKILNHTNSPCGISLFAVTRKQEKRELKNNK